jgi:hypothetical protein
MLYREPVLFAFAHFSMRSKLLKSTLIVFLLVMFCCAVFIFFPHLKNEQTEDTRVGSFPSFGDISGMDYDGFEAENISVVKKRDQKTFLSLTADRITHRKRSSRFFYYQNLKEIYLSGVTIDVYLDAESGYNTLRDGLIPLDDMNSILTSFGKPPTSPDEFTAGKIADSELDLLSRIIFKNISITIHHSKNKKFSISARKASVHFDLNNIVFEDSVRITGPFDRTLCSSKAVWSKRFKGLYFPKGYVLQAKNYKKKAFYSLNDSGDLLPVADIPKIDYIDHLGEAEAAIYTKIVKKIPPPVKMMLGIPLY